MSTIPFLPEKSDPIDRQAAEWLVKRDRGLTAAEQDDFCQWLAADPRHGEAFARQRRTWQEFNLLAEWKPEHSAEPNPDLLAKPARRAPIIRWISFAALATAAGLAIVFLRPGKSVSQHSPFNSQLAAAQGYERRVLPDGSVVELNAGARIEVDYQPAGRHVRLLQGEASFTVAKNPDRPFTVRAGGVDVRAVGTVFNVRLDAKSVEVLVTEGKVRVDDAARGYSLLQPTTSGEIPVLGEGKRVIIEAAPIAPVVAAEVTPAEVTQLLAWKPVMLDFNSQPLSEVVNRFNEHNRVQVVLADSALADLPIVASFRSDNIDGFVRLLELTAGVRVERHGDLIKVSATR